jgi:hypothetical protein
LKIHGIGKKRASGMEKLDLCELEHIARNNRMLAK